MFPKPLDECIQPLTQPAFSKKGLAGSRIVADWGKIAGSSLAAYCTPIKVSFPREKTTDGTLTIAVEPGFAPQLQHMEYMILERLAVYFGYKAISRIKINHTLPHAAPEKKRAQQKPVLSHIPKELIEEVNDEELRQTLLSYAETLSGKS